MTRWYLILAAIHLIWLGSCLDTQNNSSSGSLGSWTKIMEVTPWPASYNFQMLTFRDTLWVFHGDGNWFSADGISWEKSTLPNAIGNLAFLDYVVFKDTLFGLGHFDGNSENHILRRTIYFSTDAARWDSLPQADLPARYFYHPFVFKDKLWIIGGEDESNVYADIAVSQDGLHWQIMKDNLPFGPTTENQFVVMRDSIWMLGKDVWVSADGYEWIQRSPVMIAEEPVFGYAAVGAKEQLWLIGCNRESSFDHKVMYSVNGKHWETMDAPWSPRGGVAAVLFKNAIFMTGGKYGGTPSNPEFIYSRDLWKFSFTP